MGSLTIFVKDMIYRLILNIRHFLYDKGLKKSYRAEVPTICVGNVTVGGTGKTPHTEMILQMLLDSDEWGAKNIAVLSRGYKRNSRGFQQVTREGSAEMFGDEPLQIKRKFPSVTVAVDKDRIEGCRYLCHPDLVQKKKNVWNKNFPPADIIVLDDAYQYRRLKADRNVILVNWNRPVFNDRLLPFGRLRDLPSRVDDADVIIVTKCPPELDDWEKTKFAFQLGLGDFATSTCRGTNGKGRSQLLLFTTVEYCDKVGVYSTSDPRYFYSKKLIMVTGIAKDTALRNYLCDYYRILKRFSFPDHHRYTKSDVREIMAAVKSEPTCSIATTEKDAQRILDFQGMPQTIMARMFYVPIKVSFLSFEERRVFFDFLRETRQ